MKKLMKAFVVVCLLLEMNLGVLFAQEQPKSIEDMLTDIVRSVLYSKGYRDDEEISRATNRFFKGWSNFEYFKILAKLNNAFMKKETLSRTTQRIDIQSELAEIFGGIYLKNQFKKRLEKGKNVYFIPENLLDPVETIMRVEADVQKEQKNSRYHPAYHTNYNKHDGAIVDIVDNGRDIDILKVLEVKLNRKRYEVQQSRGVFIRWRHQGVCIGDYAFFPEDIALGSSVSDLQDGFYYRVDSTEFDNNKLKSSNPNYNNEVMIYDNEIFCSMTKISSDFLEKMSNSIYERVVKDDFEETLTTINEVFIYRILDLFKKYIQIYKKIPSVYDDIEIDLSSLSKEQVSEEDKAYFESVQNRKDLIITLYSIYRNDILFSIFKEKISQFFTSEEIKNINSLLNDQDIVRIDLITDTKKTTIDTLVILLGEEYRSQIETVVEKYHVSTRDPSKDLKNKFALLKSFVKSLELEKDSKATAISNLITIGKDESLSDVLFRALILSQLRSFILISPAKLIFYIERLQKIRKLVSSNLELFLLMLPFNFSMDKVEIGRADNIQRQIKFLQENFPEYFCDKSNYEIISFIFEKGWETSLDEVIKKEMSQIINGTAINAKSRAQINIITAQLQNFALILCDGSPDCIAIFSKGFASYN